MSVAGGTICFVITKVWNIEIYAFQLFVPHHHLLSSSSSHHRHSILSKLVPYICLVAKAIFRLISHVILKRTFILLRPFPWRPHFHVVLFIATLQLKSRFLFSFFAYSVLLFFDADGAEKIIQFVVWFWPLPSISIQFISILSSSLTHIK